MKILFDHPNPFLLAHGGFQIQIEQTKAALEEADVEVEYLRWWDATQQGDIIHYFGRPTGIYVDQAHAKGMKVLMADLLTAMGSRSPTQLRLQRLVMSFVERALPGMMTERLGWRSFRMADACVALTAWEARLMQTMFRAPAERLHIVPNGVERVFLESAPASRGEWLVCTATVTERKRVLELAEAAVLAQTPVWIIGRPYGETDPYAQRFQAFARRHPNVVRFEGPVGNRAELARIYHAARGFVLLSTIESHSLSAEEAAGCGCPLLLSDLPWARTVFGEHARYCPINGPVGHAAQVLKEFYQLAPSLPPPRRPLDWAQVVKQFQNIYASLLSSSR